MSQSSMSPEVKKAIWKIVIYAVSVFAALFGGNAMAKNGIHFINPQKDTTYVCVSK